MVVVVDHEAAVTSDLVPNIVVTREAITIVGMRDASEKGKDRVVAAIAAGIVDTVVEGLNTRNQLQATVVVDPGQDPAPGIEVAPIRMSRQY